MITLVQELILEQRCRPRAKTELTRNFVKCIFQGFWLDLLKSYTLTLPFSTPGRERNLLNFFFFFFNFLFGSSRGFMKVFIKPLETKKCENKSLINFHFNVTSRYTRRIKIDFLSSSYFCRTPQSGCFCILYSLWVRHSKCSTFFQYLHFSEFGNDKCGNIQEETSDTYNDALYSPGDFIVMRVCYKDFPQYLYTINE